MLLWKKATLCQWKAFRTEATDLEICVSGGRVRANVGKSSLLEVSSCVQNCSWFFIFFQIEKRMREKKVKNRSNEDKLSFQMVAGIGRKKKRSIMLQIFFYTAS